MASIEELRTISGTVVRRLRNQKLAKGKPFLIWSDKLPKNQSYIEYPDHSIKIVTLTPDLKSFTLVSELTSAQTQNIREELDLF